MKSEKKGRCACGAVTVSVRPGKTWVGYCHCSNCRKATGAPVSCYVGVKVADVTLEGPVKSCSLTDGVRRTWCDACGSPLAYESTRWPDEMHFHIGVFDEVDELVPEFHVYTKEQVSWFDVKDDLPRSKEPGS